MIPPKNLIIWVEENCDFYSDYLCLNHPLLFLGKENEPRHRGHKGGIFDNFEMKRQKSKPYFLWALLLYINVFHVDFISLFFPLCTLCRG
jgi:hypothetical protein